MHVAGCLLVQSHALLRDGLSSLIGQTWPSVQVLAAGSLQQAVALLSGNLEVMLVLLDLDLPDSQGIDTLRRLRLLAPTVPVIVMSVDERAQTVVEAAEAGACGYIPKAADWPMLKAALADVLVACAAQGAAPRTEESTDVSQAGQAQGLTSRQMAVLRLLAEGKSNKCIGRELDMAQSTVKTHLEAIFARLAVKTRTQAVVEASRRGLLREARRAQAGAD